jgi:hypothetical protein
VVRRQVGADRAVRPKLRSPGRPAPRRELFRLLPAPDAIAKPVNGELEIAA